MDWNLFSDVSAFLSRNIVTLLLRIEVGNLFDGVHALLHGLGGAGQVGGRGEDVETFNFGNIVTFWHGDLFRNYDGNFLTGFC